MATRLGAHMQGLGAMPAHAGAPALANLLQALQAALESCSSAAASQVPHAASTGLQRLYAGLLQQALAVLLDSAAASFAALPVMAVADGRLSEPLNKHLLLHLLGQVGHLASSHLEDTICKDAFLQLQLAFSGFHGKDLRRSNVKQMHTVGANVSFLIMHPLQVSGKNSVTSHVFTFTAKSAASL